MKKLFFTLALCLGLTGCVEERVYSPPGMYVTGTVEFCDDYGCRWVTAPYYYDGDDLIYWDAHFGVWIGPYGYWHGGYWHRGWHPGYHGWYHQGWYHYSDRGWRAGSGYHGYHPHGHR